MASIEDKITYIDSNVLDEAKRRIRHIIETFDYYVVSFSGGKDSLVTLHLVESVMREMGIEDKVKVVFRDEEFIPDYVIDFVQKYAESGRYEFYYYCVPLISNKFFLGITEQYVQWDVNRKHIRKEPPYAITLDTLGLPRDTVFDQYSMDGLVASNFKGKVAIFNGIRTQESITRLASILVKKDEPYIASTKSNDVKFCKPIYDWSEGDIFKYLYDEGIAYCDIYNHKWWNREQLRVSTPLHSESAKQFDKLKTLAPVLYEQIIDLYPEMKTHELYWKQLDRYGNIYRYEKSFSGILQMINDTIEDPAQRKKAKEKTLNAYTIRKNKQLNGELGKNYGGYPVLYVFKTIVNGGYKREIQPCLNPTKQMHEYEKEVIWR